MQPLETLDRLVREYGIRPEFAWSLRGLVERAQGAPPAVAERLLRLVERSARAEGEREAARRRARARQADADLRRLARQLHGWTPSEAVQGLEPPRRP